MARVLEDTPGHSPPLWLIWTDVHLCFCTSPHLIPKLGAPWLKDLPTFHTPDPLKALRLCPGGACTGAGLAMGTRTWLMSFLDAGVWTEATLINLHLITGRKGDA